MFRLQRVFLTAIVSLNVLASAGTVCAEPNKDDISRADSLIELSTRFTNSLDSLTSVLDSTSVSLVDGLFTPRMHSSLREKTGLLCSKAGMMVDSLTRVYHRIRVPLRTMRDFQSYPPLLLEILLAKSNLSDATARVLLSSGHFESRVVSKAASRATIISLLLAVTSIALGVLSVFRWKLNQLSLRPALGIAGVSRLETFTGPPLGVGVVTVLVAATVLIFGPVEVGVSSSWSSLIVIVSGFTLAFLCQYVIDTSRIAREQIRQSALTQTQLSHMMRPVIGYTFNTDPDPNKPGKHDHGFRLRADMSKVDAKVLVNANARVIGKIVDFGDRYNGTEPWNVSCYGGQSGHFTVDSILDKALAHLQTVPHTVEAVKDHKKKNGQQLKDVSLSLTFDVAAKRWDAPDEEYQKLPPHHYEYDFHREVFKFVE